MNASYKILDHRDVSKVVDENYLFALDVLHGLSEMPKRLKTRYCYNAKGSRLFQKIMKLPEYYPTQCEYQILNDRKKEISKLISKNPVNLIELGAGDGLKTNILLEYSLQENIDLRYIPIDISESAIKLLVESISKKFPQLKTEGIVAEYFEALKWISKFTDQKNMILFLGSNLGNFSKEGSRIFLRSLWDALNDGDYVLIGFDIKKDIDIMLKAYNDSQGITAAFNLNLLERINQELDGDFDIESFRFYATYNVFSGAIESYLVSQKKQEIHIKGIGQTFFFEAWEPIHTEYSYKYLESDIEQLAEGTGFKIVNQLYDSKKHFLDSIWRVDKID